MNKGDLSTSVTNFRKFGEGDRGTEVLAVKDHQLRESCEPLALVVVETKERVPCVRSVIGWANGREQVNDTNGRVLDVGGDREGDKHWVSEAGRVEDLSSGRVKTIENSGLFSDTTSGRVSVESYGTTDCMSKLRVRNNFVSGVWDAIGTTSADSRDETSILIKESGHRADARGERVWSIHVAMEGDTE